MLVFSQIVPEDFLRKFLPDYILTEVLAGMDINRFAMMDEYFDSIGVNMTTKEIIEYALKNMDVKEVNDSYVVDFSNILQIDGYPVRQLVNIIDYGNTEVRGTRAISDIEEYIRSHRSMLMNLYSPEE